VTGTSSSTAGYTPAVERDHRSAARSGYVHPRRELHRHLDRPGSHDDTEIYLYDIQPAFEISHSDDYTAIAGQSTVTAVLPAGFYIVAISNYNTSNNQSDAIPPEIVLDGPAARLPNALANDNATTALNVAFSVSDGTTTTPVAATKTTTYGVRVRHLPGRHAGGVHLVLLERTLGVDHTYALPVRQQRCAPATARGHSFDANGANLTASGRPPRTTCSLTSSNDPDLASRCSCSTTRSATSCSTTACCAPAAR
jgi:hypothetical protein